MWEDWEYYGDSEWYLNPTDDPAGPIDPYAGNDALGATINDGNKIGDWTLKNMDEDIYDTNDETQTGGFWSDLGNALTGTLGNLAGSAITNAGTAGSQWIKKTIPTPTTPAATTTPDKTNLYIGLAVAALVAFLVFKHRD